MSGRIHQSGGSSHDPAIYRVNPSASSQQEKKDAPQQEARSSYSFRDSRHVVRGGIASVSLELAVDEENAEHIELLGFAQGDHLLLEGSGSVSGTALIRVLTQESLEVDFSLTVPPSARRAAATLFERLSVEPYTLDEAGTARLSSCVSKDGKGGYRYILTDEHQNKRLMADVLDLRIDNFSTHLLQQQALTFIVTSGNTLTLAIEMAPGKEPKGKLKVSAAPGMGEFDVRRLERH